MRTSSTVVALALASAPGAALAQGYPGPQPVVVPRREPPQNVISTNPLSLVLGGTLNVEYERALAPAVSLFIGPQLQFSQGVFNTTDASVFGLGVLGGARFYLFGEAPRGFFLSPQVSAGWVTAKSGSAEGSGSGFALAALAGYQWIIARHFAISVGLGVQYLRVSAAASSGSSSAVLDVAGVLPAARFALGGAF